MAALLGSPAGLQRAAETICRGKCKQGSLGTLGQGVTLLTAPSFLNGPEGKLRWDGPDADLRLT